MLNFISKLFRDRPKLGIIGPDQHDSRDYIYAPKRELIASAGISKEFSLLPMSCGILNQKNTNSCTGHAAACACNILLSKITGVNKDYNINPFYPYYYARYIDGMQQVDGGAYVRSLMKALKQYGVCSCNLSNPLKAPPNDVTTKTFKLKDYKRLSNLVEDIQYAIQIEHLPVIISFMVNWEDIDHNTGIIKTYDENSFRVDGYHAVVIIGWKYIDNELYFIIQNSWGKDFGDNGLYYLHSEYITNICKTPDIWVFDFAY